MHGQISRRWDPQRDLISSIILTEVGRLNSTFGVGVLEVLGGKDRGVADVVAVAFARARAVSS